MDDKEPVSRSKKVVIDEEVEILGPIKFWGVDFCISGMTLEEAKDTIKSLATSGTVIGEKQRIAGYFGLDKNANVLYHMSRYPRYTGEPVFTIKYFQDLSNKVEQGLKTKAKEVTSKEEKVPALEKSLVRVIIGTTSGYSEKKHDVNEMIERLAKEGFQEVERVSLLSARAEGSHWEEDCLKIIFSESEENLKKIISFAKAYEQDNFSIEYLTKEESSTILLKKQ